MDHFKKLSGNLKVHISKFVISIDKKCLIFPEIEEKDFSKYPDLLVIIPIVEVFPECREYYKDIMNGVKLRHQLRIYSKRYLDVLLLSYKVRAIQQGEIEFPMTEIIYRVEFDRLVKNNNLFIDREANHELMFGDSLGIDSMIIEKICFNGMYGLDIYHGFGCGIRTIKNSLVNFNRKTFPNLHERDIFVYQRLNRLHYKSYLHLGLFKDLVTKK